MYIIVLDGDATSSVKEGKKCLHVPPFDLLVNLTTKKSSPAVSFKSVEESKDASLQLAHPLTSICVITPFDTWFHMTKWPTGWTTKTRNRTGGQWIQMALLRPFLSSHESQGVGGEYRGRVQFL